MNTVGIKHRTSASQHEIIDFVYNCLQNYGWKTTFNYSICKPLKFHSKPLTVANGCRAEFTKYLEYCFLLSNNFTAKDEATRYKDNYGTGIYFSVVLYWLLVYFGAIREQGLKFCQGYFSYQMKDEASRGPRYRAGMHAWLTYLGAVIDVTIWQQKDHFDFATLGFDVPVIRGEIPLGMNMVGFEEDRSLVKEYARKFARDSGLTFFEWVNYHKQQADLLSSVRSIESPALPG